MDLSMDNYQRKIINPVWNTSYKSSHNSQVNMWPTRHVTHSKRFYGNSKLKSNQSDNKTEIIPITFKLGIDDLEKSRSYMSMAFCSTSKVKYMPLPGSPYDPFAGLKLGTNHPFIFPTLSRPVSRPVLLHGKRYTVIATETNRATTSFAHLNPDDCWSTFKSEQMNSDQRKRFNEVEHSKSNIKLNGLMSEGSEMMQLRRNYCLSGHQIKIRSSKATVAERLVKLQPILNFQNRLVVLQKSHDRPTTSVVPELHDPDFTGENISQDENSDCRISVNIADKEDKAVALNSEETTQSIEKIIQEYQTIIIDEEKFVKSKEWIIDLILGSVEEFSRFSTESPVNTSDVSSLWELLQPLLQLEDEISNIDERLVSNLNEYKSMLNSSEIENTDVVSFLDTVFPDENENLRRYYWSKIFDDLNIEIVNESIFSSLIRMKLIINSSQEDNIVSDESFTLLKLSFWISLFKTFFHTTHVDVEKWAKRSTLIVFNNNPITKELRIEYEEEITKFISENFQKGQQLTTMMDSFQTLPWILRTHMALFQHHYTIDEVATIRALITDENYHQF